MLPLITIIGTNRTNVKARRRRSNGRHFIKMVGTKVDEGQMQKYKITDIGCPYTYPVTKTLPLQVT